MNLLTKASQVLGQAVLNNRHAKLANATRRIEDLRDEHREHVAAGDDDSAAKVFRKISAAEEDERVARCAIEVGEQVERERVSAVEREESARLVAIHEQTKAAYREHSLTVEAQIEGVIDPWDKLEQLHQEVRRTGAAAGISSEQMSAVPSPTKVWTRVWTRFGQGVIARGYLHTWPPARSPSRAVPNLTERWKRD